MRVARAKREKTCANESRLVLVLYLIGWEGGTGFLNWLLTIVMQNQENSRYITHSNENGSLREHGKCPH